MPIDEATYNSLKALAETGARYKRERDTLEAQMDGLAKLHTEALGQLHVLRADLENAQRLARIQADEHEKLRAENAKLRETYAAAHEAHLKIRAENADLRKSVATMACDHKGIGLPDCRICDPRTKPGAGT